MTGERGQRGRVRLARQRPAPDRVRPRGRTEGSGRGRGGGAGGARNRSVWQRFRRANWSHTVTVTGTALAAVAAIGGLWAQAVASYWTQETAEDQLSQSREESVRRLRDQASKVTYWGGGGSAFRWGGTGAVGSSGDGSSALHVLNRSPDPVPRAAIGVEIRTKDPDDVERKREVWVISLTDIPPCTHIAYPETELVLGAVYAEDDRRTIAGEKGVWNPLSMKFTDTRGREWTRTETSLKGGSAPGGADGKAMDAMDAMDKAVQERRHLVGEGAEVREADSCEDANGGSGAG
ncbi:hypothetical protein [Streptomyces cacaoi]|uniref:hypothetical protein n=1 Tax=Streptomyces cacaoi TaxID=1898 RepID=UPI003330A535